MKNWKKIAEVKNPQIQLALIQASGSDAEAMKRAYPECFADGSHPRMKREEFICVVAQMKNRMAVEEACKEADLPTKVFGFCGSCRGTTDGVPYSEGGYDTVANGSGQYFTRSSKRRGETLEFEGAKWLVVWNGYSPGSPEFFASHSLVIVPTEALDE